MSAFVVVVMPVNPFGRVTTDPIYFSFIIITFIDPEAPDCRQLDYGAGRGLKDNKTVKPSPPNSSQNQPPTPAVAPSPSVAAETKKPNPSADQVKQTVAPTPAPTVAPSSFLNDYPEGFIAYV